MSFSINVAQFARRAKASLDDTTRTILLELGSRVVLRSPVGDGSYWKSPPPPGYAGGRFRANWQHGFGTIPAGELASVDASGGASISRINAGVKASPAAGVHYLANNLPYAQAIENGHSRQAPKGVVALTVVEFGAVVKGSVK